MNYFEMLGLELKYDIDLLELKKQYFLMQAKHHPDRAQGSDKKKEALNISMQLNEAYKILQDDYLRAEYLLKLKGQKFDDQLLKNALSIDELDEILTEQEFIEECTELPYLIKMENINLAKKAAMLRELCIKFKEDKLNEALDLTLRLKYLTNLLGNIRLKLKYANNRD